MKYIAAFAVAFTLLISASHAVTWYTVTVAIVVNQGGATITKTSLTTKKYLDEGVRRFGGDPNTKNYFVGVRPDTGVVAVVHIPSKTIVYNIVSNLTFQGLAANGTNTLGTGAGNATVSSLNTDMTGFFYDKFANKTDNTLKSLSRLVVGGGGNQTLTGTIRASAKKFEI